MIESATNSTACEVRESGHELVLSRVFNVPCTHLFAAWTQHLPKWWGTHGMTTSRYEMELRPGGVFKTVMRAPDGSEYPTSGVFLEIVPNARIVFTDAFAAGWKTASQPFMVAVVTFEPLPENRTRHTLSARHWSEADREKHLQMGFHQGWSESLDRLAAVAAAL